MLVSSLSFILGLLIGMVIITFRNSERPRVKNFKILWRNRVQPIVFPLSMTAGTIYLVIANARAFFDPKPVNSLTELGVRFLENPADETVILLVGFVLIVVLLSILLRTPIANWQQVKVLGLFEATKIREEAREELKYNRELDFNRMVRVQAITSVEDGYQSVVDRISGINQLDAESLLETVGQAIAKAYADGDVKLNVQYGIVHLSQASASANCPQGVRELIFVLQDHEAQIYFNGWESCIVCPVTCGPGEEYAIWLRSADYQFSEVDIAYIESIRNATEHYVALALYESSAKVV